MALYDAWKLSNTSDFHETFQLVTRSEGIKARTPRLPTAENANMEGRVTRVCRILNELRGNSFSSSDEEALHQVVESYFWEEDDDDLDPPNGTAHKNE